MTEPIHPIDPNEDQSAIANKQPASMKALIVVCLLFLAAIGLVVGLGQLRRMLTG